MSVSPATGAPPHVVEDCRGLLRVLSDGTILRSSAPLLPSSLYPDDLPSVQWKDSVYDEAKNLHVRMYKPSAGAAANGEKLPVLVYFHGGGFCLGSRTWPSIHFCCLRLAAELPAVVLSFDYRLAPEHRLPAAIDDAATALTWLRDQCVAGELWLAGAADFGRVFISGESAGGNLSHHMAVRFGSAGLSPVRVRGFALIMPAFVGAAPTRSESECPAGAFLNKEMFDRYGRLALPVGASMDHPAVNPFGPDSVSLEAVDVGNMLVAVAERDILRDRNLEYARRLTAMRKNVDVVEFAGEEHAFFTLKPRSASADELILAVGRFINKASAS